MVILGIETSCDETSAAIVKDGRGILSHVIASSQEIHKKTGGIIPEQAAREQAKSIIPVIEEALSKAFSTNLLTYSPTNRINAIAVTVGPGLIGSLLVGVETAKTLSYVWKKPLIPVNHLVGHIYANFVCEKSNVKNQMSKVPQFPAVALVVSGGHTDLVLMKSHSKLEWLGGTRDDAAGEAFDKTARLLKLGYPGGPAIAASAAKLQIPNSKLQIKLPRPLLNNNDLDFSFSGLKTAVLKITQKVPTIPTALISHETQEAITDVLVTKTLKAVKKYKTPTVLIAGGVAANSRLREKFENSINQLTNQPINLFIPPPSLCTDNAAMIAAAAYYNHKPLPWKKVKAEPGLTIAENF